MSESEQDTCWCNEPHQWTWIAIWHELLAELRIPELAESLSKLMPTGKDET